MKEPFDVNEFLDELDEDVKSDLSSMPEVVDKGHTLDISKLPITVRRWHKVRDIVAVVADLKSSTQLGVSRYQASTASIYEASTGNVTQILGEFEADFIDIQGDGAFGLFWGDNRMARAVCAGITIKTFSEWHLVPQLENKWPDSLPDTGLKVGIANSPILVKKIGLARTEHQAPVWAGKAVNFAAKCAQQADRHEMIVTGSVWDWISGNDYLAVSCGCRIGSPSSTIWTDVTIDKLREDEPDREGKLLTSFWCEKHGAEFCENVLLGKSKRSDVKNERTAAIQVEMSKAIRERAKRNRRDRAARRQGLR